MPPGGTPPAGAVAPPAGPTPPTPPTGGSSLGDGLSQAKKVADKAKDAHDKAQQIRDQAQEVRDRVDELTPDEPEEDEDEAIAEPQSDPIYVNYADVWEEETPAPTTHTVVVTRVVRPAPTVPPPPVPEPDVEEPRVRGFIGFSSRATTTNANLSALLGARGGFTFRDRLTIGAAYHSVTARYAEPIVDSRGNPHGIRMNYGGVMLGWRVYNGRVVQFGLDTLAGAGAACIARGTKSVGRARCIDKVGLVSLEAGLELGFVVTDWARLGLTGGYRFITREAWHAPNDFTLSGPYMGLNVDIGRFRERR